MKSDPSSAARVATTMHKPQWVRAAFSLCQRFQQYDLRYTHLYMIPLIDSACRRAYLVRARPDALKAEAETEHRPRPATPEEEVPPMEALTSAVVVTSDADSRYTLLGILSSCGLDAVAAETLKETRSLLARHPVSVVVCDEQLSDGSFRDVLREAARLPRKVPVIVSSRSVDWKHYLSILSAGAFDYFTYPPRRREVEYLLGNALNVPVWSCRVSDAALGASAAEHRAGN